MFILTVKGYEEDGAFALEDDNGERVLLMFEEEDDADRYVGLMEVDDEFPEMNIIEIDDAVAIKACQMHDYVYNVITPEDIIVPPKNDPIRKDKMA